MGTLLRVYLNGRGSVPALQEDYAFYGQGLVALYDATADPRWLTRAQELADAMWQRFVDPESGGLFMAQHTEDTPTMARPKDIGDGAMPSGTSAALALFAGLARRTDAPVYRERADALLTAVSGGVQQAPQAFPSLLIAMQRLRHGEVGPLRYGADGAVRVSASIRSGTDAETTARNNAGATAGASQRLQLDIHIQPGWHINAHRPLQGHLIPTRLEADPEVLGWQLWEPRYPPAEVLRLGFQAEPLAVYQGRIRIEANLEEQPPSVLLAPLNLLSVVLHLQACSDAICLAPKSLTLRVPKAMASDHDAAPPD